MVGTCLEGLVHVFTLASNRGQDAVKQCLAALGMSDTIYESHVNDVLVCFLGCEIAEIPLNLLISCINGRLVCPPIRRE